MNNDKTFCRNVYCVAVDQKLLICHVIFSVWRYAKWLRDWWVLHPIFAVVVCLIKNVAKRKIYNSAYLCPCDPLSSVRLIRAIYLSLQWINMSARVNFVYVALGQIDSLHGPCMSKYKGWTAVTANHNNQTVTIWIIARSYRKIKSPACSILSIITDTYICSSFWFIVWL